MAEVRIAAFITHVDSEGPFIKLWIQKDMESVSCVQQVLLKLSENFDNGLGVCTPNELRESQLVCAKFGNDTYYRAKILSLKELSSKGILTVQFIDYGNSESITVENIRAVNSLPPSVISQTPPLASESILAGVLPATKEWSLQMIKSIHQNMCFTKIECIVEGQISSKEIITVFTEGVNLASSMMKLGLAMEISIRDQNTMATQYYAAKTEPSDGSEVDTLKETAVIRTLDGLVVGTEYHVYISCVDNGARGFFVQLQQKEEFLTDMMTDLNACPRVPLQASPVPGSACFAKFPEDTLVCRALVTAVNNDMCKLFFLDYGSTATYHYSQLYELPSRFLSFKPLAYRFYLRGSNVLPHNHNIRYSFVKLIESELLKLQVVPNDEEGDPTRQCCNIFKDNKDVLLALLHKISGLSTVFAPLELEPNKQYSVVVSHVDMTGKLPWVFYVQLESQIDKLEQLMVDVNKFCRTIPESKELIVPVGCPILAKYKQDDNWYRAKLLSKTGDNVVVKFVDYGNDEVVEVIETRPSHADINDKLPVQAVLCRLQSVDTVVYGAERFSEVTTTKSLTMIVVSKLETGELLVRVFDPSSYQPDLGLALLTSPYQQMAPPALPIAFEWVPQVGGMSSLVPPTTQLCNPPPSMAGSSRRSSISDVKCILPMLPSSSHEQSYLVRRPSLTEVLPTPNVATRDPRVFNPPTFQDREWGDKPFSNPPSADQLSKPPAMSREGKPLLQEDRWGASNGPSLTVGSGGPSKPSMSNEKWGDKMQEERPNMNNRNEGGVDNDCGDKKFFCKGRDWKKEKERQLDRRADSRQRSDDEMSWESGKSTEFKKSYRKYEQTADRGGFSSRSSLTDDSWEAASKLRFTSLQTMVGTTLRAYAAFLVDPWDFYVQPDGTDLELLMEEIADLCKSGGSQQQEVAPEDAVLAKYSEDGTWYRAKVLSVKEGRAKVMFVDYGNVDEVDVLSAVKEACPDLLTLPTQAVRCRLRGARPSSGDKWSEQDITRFIEALTDKRLEVELVAVEGLRLMQFSVVLRSDNVCFNQQFGASPASLLPRKNLPEKTPVPDETEVVFGWFVTPDDFHVIFNDRMKERGLLQEKLEDPEVPALQTVEEGDLVLAPHDGNFFRGLVVATRDCKARVYNLDTGNTLVIQKSQLRAMPESLKVIPAFSIPCKLAGVAPPAGTKWNLPAVNEVFRALPTFFMSVQSRSSDGKLAVTLTDGSTSVSEQLVNKGLACEVKPEEDRLSPGHSCQVFVCFSEGLCFYVHQAAQVPQLDLIQQRLQTLQAPPPSSHTLMAAARKCDDGFWYRARPIAAASEKGTPILFVDYGNKETCTDLKQLPEELIKIAPFATPCLLPIKPLSGQQFSNEATDRFESLAFDDSLQSLKAKVLAMSSDGNLIVDLIVGEEKTSITEVLVSEKLVLPLLTQAYISNVESPSEFFIQKVEDETKLQEMEERLAVEEFENLEKVEVGKQCIAKFTADEAWYRASVIAVTEKAAQVLFIDYGNSAVATEFKKLPEDLASIPAMATLCAPNDMPSNDAETKLFLDQAMDGTVVYQVLMMEDGETSPMKVVLIKDGKDLMECIKEKCKKESGVTTEPKKESAVRMEVYEIEPKTAETSQKMEKSANLIDVYVSYCISPSEFWYQKVEDENKLFDIQERLPQLDEMVVAPTEGLLCAALFKDDETWYRGKLVSLDPQETLFIDYGNTGEATAFKTLPEDLKRMSPFAKKASLMSLPDDAKMCDKLKAILSDECTVFQVEVSEEGNNKINVYKEGQNLLQVVGYEPKLTDVIVSHFVAPNLFYVQVNSELSKLDDLQSCLEEGTPLGGVKKDDKCVAKFTDDDGWYRAIVTSVTDESTNVFSYDYGNSATATEFKKMTEELEKIPPMAKLCHLPFNPQKSFNEEAEEKLATLLGDPAGPVFQADLSNYKEGSSFGVSLMKDGVSVLKIRDCELQVKGTAVSDLATMSEIEEEVPPMSAEVKMSPSDDTSDEQYQLTKNIETVPDELLLEKKTEGTVFDSSRKDEEQDEFIFYSDEENYESSKESQEELKVTDVESEIKSVPVGTENTELDTVVVPVEAEMSGYCDMSLPYEKDVPDLNPRHTVPDLVASGQAFELQDNKETEIKLVKAFEKLKIQTKEESKPKEKVEVSAETSKQKASEKVEKVASSVGDMADQTLYVSLSECSDDDLSSVGTSFTSCVVMKSPSKPVMLKQALTNVNKLNQVDYDESLEIFHSTSEIVSESPQIAASTPILVTSPKGSKHSKIPSFIPLEGTPN